MRYQAPNLARQPFQNDRVVGRVAILLWALGGLLLVGNLAVYWGYLTGSKDRRAQLAEIEAAIDDERAWISELEGELRRLDLAQQNRQVGFLNQKIAERTFGWSSLFDHLAEALPDDVRVQRLSPRFGEGRPGRRQPSGASREAVSLAILGEARKDEALLHLLDSLFEHPAFERPKLQRESRDGSRTLQFNLQVEYWPEGLRREEVLLADEAVEGERVVPVPLGHTASPVEEPR